MMPEAKSVSRLQLACDEVDRVLGAGAALLARSIPAAPCLWFSLNQSHGATGFIDGSHDERSNLQARSCPA